jgi:hypothetical protein
MSAAVTASQDTRGRPGRFSFPCHPSDHPCQNPSSSVARSLPGVRKMHCSVIQDSQVPGPPRTTLYRRFRGTRSPSAGEKLLDSLMGESEHLSGVSHGQVRVLNQGSGCSSLGFGSSRGGAVRGFPGVVGLLDRLEDRAR